MKTALLRWGTSVALSFLVVVPAFTVAQDAARTQDAVRRGAGIELALYGSTNGVLGHTMHLQGVTYEVQELAELRRLPQATVRARLVSADPTQTRFTTVTETTATSDASGRFTLALDIPVRPLSTPRITIVVSHHGMQERTFEFGSRVESPIVADMLTDRVLYQPGETVHTWTRVFDSQSRIPEARRELHVSCHDPNGRLVAERVINTSNAGTAVFDLALSAAAPEGEYRARASMESAGFSQIAEQVFRVGRRTVERVMLSAELDQNFVRPAGRLRGRVTVRTPSGAAVRGAQVEIRVPGRDEPTIYQSDANGVVSFDVQAPAYLAGDVQEQTLDIRAIHPAHGTLRTAINYRLTRAPYSISVVAANGAVAPELSSTAYVLVETASGDPAPAGLHVLARGTIVRGGSARATTDAHGLLAIPLLVPRSAAAQNETSAGACSTMITASFDMTIEGAQPVSAHLNACVATDADVVPRVVAPLAIPGAEVAFDLQRRPRAMGRAVLVEAVTAQNRVCASVWLDPSALRGTIRLPDDQQGVIQIRARALTADNVNAPLDERSPTMAGPSMSDAILVRPADAFSLQVEAPTDPVQVRARARVGLRANHASMNSHAAILVRDLAAHGGEQAWERAWISETLDGAVTAPNQADNELFLRASLAETLSAEAQPIGVAPLTPRPWDEDERSAEPDALRDPSVLRAELLRRGIGVTMQIIEHAIAEIGSDPEAARGLLIRNGNRSNFDPRIIDTLVDQGALRDANASTLGQTRMRIEMLTRADPSFTFDHVARRIARARLVGLMAALVSFSDPENTRAAREISGEPPERWLSKMLDRGRITADSLVDPWGHPFSFRRAGGAGPRLVLAEAAPLYELTSAGPDGIAGNGDDVRDPFERIVARGTPYAVASGEDGLMERLSTVSAGQTVLQSMLASYESMGLQAEEERRRGPVTASSSLMDDEQSEAMMAEQGIALAGLGLARASGSGSGYGRGEGRMAATPSMAPPAPQIRDGDAMLDAQEAQANEPVDPALLAHQPRPPSGISAMGETIRERFPATLYFAGEVALDPSGATVLEIPVADALTTYRIEAIAWSPTGWVASAQGSLRVDQEANIDAPVPSFATAGDVVRVPVRVGNRTGRPLRARIEVVAEGGIAIDAPAPQTIEIPARDAVAVLVPITLRQPGEGALIVRAVRANDGASLDAVRRPMRVLADARLVRVSHETFFRGDSRFRITIPADATPRGTSELRVTRGADLFGDLSVPTGAVDLSRSIWALRVGGESVPESLRAMSRAILNAPNIDEAGLQVGGPELCYTVSAAYDDPTVTDAHMSLALQRISNEIPTEEMIARLAPSDRPFVGASVASLLIALAPSLPLASHRPALASDLARLTAQLRALIESYAPTQVDAPEAWANAALALLLTDRGSTRSRELLRRAERSVLRSADRALLDPDSGDMRALARVSPTATMALIYVLLDQPEAAMPFIRELVSLRAGLSRWDAAGHAMAVGAMLKMTGGEAPASLTATIDGHVVQLRQDDGAAVASLNALQAPGAHEIVLHSGSRSAALAFVDVRYGRPWSSVDRAARIDASVDGDVGARDGRAALRLTVANRGARVLSAPIVEIDLPAGTELDEQTQTRLTELTGAAPTIEERTLRIALRSIAPGAYVRIPLALRWSLGGNLRGLGVTVYDAGSETDGTGLRPSRIVASRLLEIADRGNEPRQTAPEVSPEPPAPPPEPLPPIRPLGPVAQVSQ